MLDPGVPQGLDFLEVLGIGCLDRLEHLGLLQNVGEHHHRFLAITHLRQVDR